MWEKTTKGRRYNVDLDLYSCTKCGSLEPKSQFTVNNHTTLNINSWCKSCNKELTRAWDAVNYKEKSKAYINKGIKQAIKNSYKVDMRDIYISSSTLDLFKILAHSDQELKESISSEKEKMTTTYRGLLHKKNYNKYIHD